MKDQNKTKAQLIVELEEFRQKVSELELIENSLIRDITKRKQAEETLRESEEKYRSLIERANDGIAIVQNGIVKLVNPRLAQLRGEPVENIVGKRLTKFIHSSERTRIMDMYRRNFTDEETGFVTETVLTRVDGGRVTAELSTGSITYEGKLAELVIVRDITERNRMEKSLRDSEARFRSLVEQSPISTILYMPDGKPLYGNPTATKLWNMTPEQVQHVYQTYNILEDIQLAEQGVLPDIQKGFTGEFTKLQPIRYDPKQIDPDYDGPQYWFQTSIYPVKDEDGTIREVVVMHEDITERRLAEEALELSHKRLLTVLDGIDADVYVSDLETYEILFMNRHMQDSFDGNSAGKACWQVFQGESGPCPHCTNDQLLDENGRSAGVVTWEGQNPITKKWYINHDRAIEWVNDRLVRLQVATDITQIKETEVALRRRSQELTTLNEVSNRIGQSLSLEQVASDVVKNVLKATQTTVTFLLMKDGSDLIPTQVIFSEPENYFDEFPNHKFGERLCGMAISERKSIFSADIFSDTRCTWEECKRVGLKSAAALPLFHGDEIFAVLGLGSDSVRDFETQASFLETLANEVAIGLQNAILYEQLQKRANDLAKLLEINRTLAISLDINSILQFITESATSIRGLGSGAIYLLEGEGLYLGATTPPLPEDFPVEFRRAKLVDHPHIDQALISLQPVVMSDISTVDLTPAEREVSEMRGLKSIIYLPLLVGARVVGILILASVNQLHQFSQEEIDAYQSFTSQAALAVENARLFSEAENRLARLASLRQIDQAIARSMDLPVTLNILLGQVQQQLEVDAAAVLLYQPELQNLKFVAGKGFRTQALKSTNLRIGEGFAGQAVSKQQIVAISDMRQLHTGFLRSPEFRNEGFVAYIGVPLIAKGNIIGVLEIYNRQPLGAGSEWMEFLETLAGQAAIAIDNLQLYTDLQNSNLQLIQAYDATIEGWAQALELRDAETRGHSHRVVDLSMELAREMGIEESQLIHVRRGALLHDIGKMGVPDSILLKPGELTRDEWKIIRQHPVYAYKWLSSILYLQPALDIPYCHHEKWDGTGYPQGLKEDQIPLSARIFAIVDVWDALLSDRPYRKAWHQEKILDYIQDKSGKHFDPRVVDSFFDLLTKSGRLA